MNSKSYSAMVEKVLTIACYRVGSNRITSSSRPADFNSITVGLVLFFGILLDHNALLDDSIQIQATFEGRVLKYPMLVDSTNCHHLDDMLSYLDELNDILFSVISSNQFKADCLIQRIRKVSCDSHILPLKGLLCGLIHRGISKVNRQEAKVQDLIIMCRQLFGFFKKLGISRPDKKRIMQRDFWAFEKSMALLTANQVHDPKYIAIVSEMRALYREHKDCFSIEPFMPKHGPGAVAEKGLNTWYEKNINSCQDSRLAYLLDRSSLGVQCDYLPFMKESNGDRTSRFITVPKTWKTLRGISAEPAELQFWQQGLLLSIDRMFTTDKWWGTRIDLHKQEHSSNLALISSLTKMHATIDLSAASDSVSTQLVRDVFKNTPLGRWLLGTRSTHTKCGTRTDRINKFAPMGSACCFPVECMIFTLAAEVACSRTFIPDLDLRGQVRVFGDDIILPYYAVDEFFEILKTLGFSVNSEKSFWNGPFREACGVEAWHGIDIRPCRYKTCKTGLKVSSISHDDLSMLVSLCNNFYERHLHTARAWLLNILFSKYIQLSKVRVRVNHTIFVTFDGESGSLSSPMPTNFQLKKEFCRSTQTYKVQRVIWRQKPKKKVKLEELFSDFSEQKLTEWLIHHQDGAADFTFLWRRGYVIAEDENPYARLPLEMELVPTIKWVYPPSCNCYDVGTSSKF